MVTIGRRTVLSDLANRYGFQFNHSYTISPHCHSPSTAVKDSPVFEWTFSRATLLFSSCVRFTCNWMPIGHARASSCKASLILHWKMVLPHLGDHFVSPSHELAPDTTLDPFLSINLQPRDRLMYPECGNRAPSDSEHPDRCLGWNFELWLVHLADAVC